MLQKHFLAYLDKHGSSFVEEWRHSISQIERAIRQGGELEISESISALLRQQGLATQLLSNNATYVYGELSTEASHTLLLCSQNDIQFSTRAQWGMFVARLIALATYQKTIGTLPVNIKWLVGIGGQKDNFALKRFVEKYRTLLQADGCLYDLTGSTPFSSPLLATGAKGLLSVTLEVQTASVQKDSIHGAILPNAAWRLTWALSSLKDAREEVLIDGFYDTLNPAGDEEIELLHSMPDNKQALAQHLGVENFLLQLQGFQLRYTQLLMPSCTITGMSTSENAQEAQHTIPSYARANVDFHLVPSQQPDDIFAKLRHHLNTQGFQDVQARILSATSPVQTPANDPFVQTVRRATLTAYGDKLPIIPLIPENVLLSALCSQLNIPLVITRIGYSEFGQHATHMSNSVHSSEQQERHIVADIKHLTMIMKGMADATRTTE